MSVKAANRHVRPFPPVTRNKLILNCPVCFSCSINAEKKKKIIFSCCWLDRPWIANWLKIRLNVSRPLWGWCEFNSQVWGLISIKKGQTNTLVWNKNKRKPHIDATVSKYLCCHWLIKVFTSLSVKLWLWGIFSSRGRCFICGPLVVITRTRFIDIISTCTRHPVPVS